MFDRNRHHSSTPSSSIPDMHDMDSDDPPHLQNFLLHLYPSRKRKTVKQACVYCRKLHKSCSDERPCKRCKARGLAHVCEDETPKKRYGKYWTDSTRQRVAEMIEQAAVTSKDSVSRSQRQTPVSCFAEGQPNFSEGYDADGFSMTPSASFDEKEGGTRRDHSRIRYHRIQPYPYQTFSHERHRHSLPSPSSHWIDTNAHSHHSHRSLPAHSTSESVVRTKSPEIVNPFLFPQQAGDVGTTLPPKDTPLAGGTSQLPVTTERTRTDDSDPTKLQEDKTNSSQRYSRSDKLRISSLVN